MEGQIQGHILSPTDYHECQGTKEKKEGELGP